MLRAALLPLALSFVLMATPVAHAQFGNVPALSLDISPTYPRPYETVSVTPSSNLIDLSASTITVSVNGKLVETGTGVQSVPVTVGGPGERTTISVSAKNSQGTYSAQAVIRPADVSLVVEPISTTHPFYRGASLVAPESTVRVVAIPDLRTAPSTRLNAKDLTYTWKYGDQTLQSASGIGQSILTATAPVRYRDAQITLTVSSADNSIVAHGSTAIAPVDPVVRIYPTDPLMGPDFAHALSGTVDMSSEEQAFRSVAYFFGVAPSLSWAVNSEPASSEHDVTVRATGAGEGTADLSLTANSTNPTQTATNAITIHFGAKKSANIFGF